MMKDLLLVDVDDVLLGWAQAFKNWVISFKDLPTQDAVWELEAARNWTLKEVLAKHLPHVVYEDLVTEFNTSPFFSDLAAITGSIEAVSSLSNFCHIKSLSSCGDAEITQQMRTNNLFEHFGKNVQSHCLPLGSCKKETLKRMTEDLSGPIFWVEDNFKNAQAGADLGLVSIYLSKCEPPERHT